MGLREVVREYVEACEEARRKGERVGEALVKLLKPIIPDLEFTMGWGEGDSDVICLWSTMYFGTRGEGSRDLKSIVEEVVGELAPHIDCPFEIWLPEDTASLVKKVLEEGCDG